MIKKIILFLSVILLLVSIPVTGFSSTSMIDFKLQNLTNAIGFDNPLNIAQSFTVKNETVYNEAQDPFLRKGTQNTEETQVSFFVIPGIVAGICLAFLFFKRK